MKRLLKLLATPVVAMAVSVGTLGAQVTPAGAQTAGVGTVQGSGTITPGLGAAPAPQSFTFTSATISLTGVQNGSAVVQASSSCTASGGSIGSENLAAGAGTGTWSCSSGALAGRSGSLIYVRVGAGVQVVITGGLNGALTCVFFANQTPPALVTSYSLTCVGTGASA